MAERQQPGVDKLLTEAEAAALANVRPATLRRALDKGELHGSWGTRSQQYTVLESHLLEWVARLARE